MSYAWTIMNTIRCVEVPRVKSSDTGTEDNPTQVKDARNFLDSTPTLKSPTPNFRGYGVFFNFHGCPPVISYRDAAFVEYLIAGKTTQFLSTPSCPTVQTKCRYTSSTLREGEKIR